MKRTIKFYAAIILITLSIINTKCKNDAGGISSKPPTKRTFIDTSRLIAVFVDPNVNDIRHDIVYKVRFDSVEKLIDKGGGTFKKQWVIDSVYYLPKLVALLDSITKKPLLDEKGNPKFKTDWTGPFRPEVVWDTGMIVDSAVARFKKYLTPDSLKKNK